MSDRPRTALFAVLCMGIFLLSLGLPAFNFSAARFNQSGIEVLVKGWLGIVVLDPRWYANLAFAYCLWGTFKGIGRRRAPLVGIALVFATYLFPVYYYPQDHGIRVEEFGPAVHLWALALLLAFVISFFTEIPTPDTLGSAPARTSRIRP